MNPKPGDDLPMALDVGSARPLGHFSRPTEASTRGRRQRRPGIAGVVLALLPLASFLGQFAFSCRAGTQQALFSHLDVMLVDWIFVPFNFFVVKVIEWRRGATLFVIACVSVILNILTHAFWQYNRVDAGHMISHAGVVLPAGWVHLAFSTLESVLLVAFVFCRKPGAPKLRVATILAAIYFLTMGICGYIMHNGFIITDVIVSLCGFFFVLVYPRLRGGSEICT
jgi:hypothetical protein